MPLSGDLNGYPYRMRARRALVAMGKASDFGNAAIALTRLLGYTDYSEIIRDTDKIKHILEGLAGPHGLTIYKMLKLRQEKSNEKG